MQVSNTQLIKESEGLRLTAYMPTANDVWTIGYGHTHTAYEGMKITKHEAEKLLLRDLNWAGEVVNRLVKVPINQNQFDALVSFTFNLGETNFGRSTLLKKLNRGDYEGAAAQFIRWNKQQNKKTGKYEELRGLTIRRSKEAALFLDEGSPSVVGKASNPDKPLWKSKEVVAGVATTGLGAVGTLVPSAQVIVVVAMVALGVFFVWNRLRAREEGERLNG